MDALNCALQYAELGYRVFPCKPGEKSPLTEHGCLDATTEPAKIIAWWERWPRANVAIATDRLCVVDVDGRNNPWLETAGPGMMAAPIQRTPGGGLHYVFRAPNGSSLKNTTSQIAPKVDTRADGGYILAAPSAVGGNRYSWVTELEGPAALPVLPDWIAAQLGVRVRVSDEIKDEIPAGKRNNTMIRFAGGMRRMGMTKEEIVSGLQTINEKRCRPEMPIRELEKIAESACRYEPDEVEERLIYQKHVDLTSPAPTVATDRPELPDLCLAPGGALQSLIEYCLASALHPQPAYALAGAISLAGTILGRRVTDQRDTRTNVYCLSVGPTSSGKEHPRKVNKKILSAIGAAEVAGSEGMGSSAGVVNAVLRAPHNCLLMQVDEIGHILACMENAKAGHLHKIPMELMKLYSSSNSFWKGEALASKDNVAVINQPNLCLMGSTTPDRLFDGGITRQQLVDGFMGRFLLFRPVEDDQPEQEDLIRGVPFELTSILRAWWEFHPGIGNLAEQNPTPVVVDWSPEAWKRYREYRDLIRQKHRTEEKQSRAIWSKSKEKVSKLALIAAALQGPPREDITVTLTDMNWAIAVTNYSNRVLLGGAETIVESRPEKNMQFVLSRIEEEITLRDLRRRCRKLTQKELNEALEALQEDGAIHTEDVQTGGRPSIVCRKGPKPSGTEAGNLSTLLELTATN